MLLSKAIRFHAVVVLVLIFFIQLAFGLAVIISSWKVRFKVHISEKGTKFCEIFPLLLTVCTVVKSKGKISQNFVAFSEYMNFTDDSLSLLPSLTGGFFMISFKLYINLSRSMADRLLRLTNCNKGAIYVVFIRALGRSKYRRQILKFSFDQWMKTFLYFCPSL